jgi:uncharacterized protein YllA (UPF0747 family)
METFLANEHSPDNFKLIRRFISAVLSHPDLFHRFLMERIYDTHVVVVLLRSNDEKVRELVAECIDQHFYAFSQILCSLYDE